METSQQQEYISIGEFARRAGVATSLIRYYESRGLLPPPRRINGRRAYLAGSVQRLSIIQGAKRLGFTLAEIEWLLDGFSEDTLPTERWRVIAQKKLPEIERAFLELTRARTLLSNADECKCATLDDCFALQASCPTADTH